ncbi:MAG: sulfite exporter TauE/SafE family protein [Alphaproteobacteria bacterium]|nr:sulfite exporter TauE/SafE family protein [Alphaproteobacteria bacterium]
MFFALATAIICTAFFIEALLGFGGGIIAVPLLAQFLEPAKAVTIVLFFQLLNSLYLASTNYKKADRQSLRLIVPSIVIASIAGVLLTPYMSQTFFMFVLGALILLDLIRARFYPSLGSEAMREAPPVLIGGVVGLILGAFGIGGPILVMYLNEKFTDRFVFRATLISIFFVSNSIRGLTSVFTTAFDGTVLKYCLIALPFFLLSIFLGQKAHNYLGQAAFRKGVELLLFLAAISLIVRSLMI